MSGGQRIGCRWLVAGPGYLPAEFQLQEKEEEEARVHRGVLLSDAPLLLNASGDDKQHVSFV